MIEAPITINIGNLCKGKIIDAFDIELGKIIANIQDIDTPAQAMRTLNLKVTFKPDGTRNKIDSEFTCESKLAQPHPQTDVFYVGKDKDSGLLYGLMYDPRQSSIVFEAPKPKEAPKPLEFKAAGE